MNQPRRTNAELVAFHLGWDIKDVRDQRYQAGRTGGIAVYTIGDDYFCAPRADQKPPKGWKWEPVGTYYGRTVYFAKVNSHESED